jgi:isocitrate dehydrogenase kinase/phosphatase
VRVAGTSVIITHCYAQRRLIPLDVYLRTAPTDEARAAVRDYGQAIADLAHAGIFPGDMLLKNFGLSRHGRVIFYDYDEIEELDDVVFREMPEGSYEDELSAEPWFSVGEHDTFPEEFIAFLLPGGALRDEFLATHRELLTAEWWRDVQQRRRAGELFDVYPYRGISGKTT